jgi:hypothetical protein
MVSAFDGNAAIVLPPADSDSILSAASATLENCLAPSSPSSSRQRYSRRAIPQQSPSPTKYGFKYNCRGDRIR